jgi:hypothetical protein
MKDEIANLEKEKKLRAKADADPNDMRTKAELAEAES